MKKLLAIAATTVLAWSLPAHADTPAENEQEIQEGVQKLRQDDAEIARKERELKELRANKAAAKARGDYGTQAKESVKIGGKQAAIGAKKAKRRVDREFLEKDVRDRDEYTAYDRRNERYSEAKPSAGKRYYGPGTDSYGNSLETPYPKTSKEGPAAQF
jgi:hypothetical protein